MSQISNTFSPLVELINFIASSGCKDPDAKSIAVTWFEPFFRVLKTLSLERFILNPFLLTFVQTLYEKLSQL